jgi:transposase InsO family protein
MEVHDGKRFEGSNSSTHVDRADEENRPTIFSTPDRTSSGPRRFTLLKIATGCARHIGLTSRPETDRAFHPVGAARVAYGIASHSVEGAAMLERWIRHYNCHRPHQGIGAIAPVSRPVQSANNLAPLHR